MDGIEGTDRSQADDSLSARLYENATGIAVTLVTAVWLTGLLTGQSWWLPALVVGYAAIIPVVATLFGDAAHDRWTGDRWRQDASASETDTARSGSGRGSANGEAGTRTGTDALETLRERYAAGELTDDQFERKLERLLGTETLEDAAEWTGRTDGNGNGDGNRNENENRQERGHRSDRDPGRLENGTGDRGPSDRDLEYES